jgi:hypothetical protein
MCPTSFGSSLNMLFRIIKGGRAPVETTLGLRAKVGYTPSTQKLYWDIGKYFTGPFTRFGANLY